MNKVKVHTCRAGQVPNKCPYINHIGERKDMKSPMKHTVSDAIAAIQTAIVPYFEELRRMG